MSQLVYYALLAQLYLLPCLGCVVYHHVTDMSGGQPTLSLPWINIIFIVMFTPAFHCNSHKHIKLCDCIKAWALNSAVIASGLLAKIK